MSIDLSYPLVPSMGQHDPLDGFITYHQLQETADRDFKALPGPSLHAEIADMADICKGKNWATDDPLGIGGLLCDAYKAAQLIIEGGFALTDLLVSLLDCTLVDLKGYTRQSHLKLPADYRLAFRELGLAIGLRAVENLTGVSTQTRGFLSEPAVHSHIESLLEYVPLGKTIETFWRESANRESGSWHAHREINMVMLATSLAPNGYLSL